MEFPVIFYQNNQIPTFLLFLPDPAERFEIQGGQICLEGSIGSPLIGIGLVMCLQKASGGIYPTVPIIIFSSGQTFYNEANTPLITKIALNSFFRTFSVP